MYNMYHVYHTEYKYIQLREQESRRFTQPMKLVDTLGKGWKIVHPAVFFFQETPGDFLSVSVVRNVGMCHQDRQESRFACLWLNFSLHGIFKLCKLVNIQHLVGGFNVRNVSVDHHSIFFMEQKKLNHPQGLQTSKHYSIIFHAGSAVSPCFTVRQRWFSSQDPFIVSKPEL